MEKLSLQAVLELHLNRKRAMKRGQQQSHLQCLHPRRVMNLIG